MRILLIKNGTIWDGEKFFCGDICVSDGKISEIADHIENENAYYTYDATGKIVSPGLVDIHTHMLGYYGINADLSTIPFGVTAAADASAEPECLSKYENYLVKNKVFVTAEIRDNKAVFLNVEKMLEHYGDKAIGLKVYFDTTVSEVRDIAPLKEICEYAKEHNLTVMVHSSISPTPMAEIVDTLNKGDILTHSYHGGIHNASEDGFECLKKAKEKGIIVDAGFAGDVHADFEIFENAIKSGVSPDTISTDITKFSAYKRGGRYGLPMCMGIAKAVGMSEEDIFRSVTSTPAKALGKENEWGYLKIGRNADIAVFDCGEEFSITDKRGNTVKIDDSYRCCLTVVDGEIVFKI